MNDADLGTLARNGDRWTLTFTRRLPHPLEKVWRAVTDAPGTRAPDVSRTVPVTLPTFCWAWIEQLNAITIAGT